MPVPQQCVPANITISARSPPSGRTLRTSRSAAITYFPSMRASQCPRHAHHRAELYPSRFSWAQTLQRLMVPFRLAARLCNSSLFLKTDMSRRPVNQPEKHLPHGPSVSSRVPWDRGGGALTRCRSATASNGRIAPYGFSPAFTSFYSTALGYGSAPPNCFLLRHQPGSVGCSLSISSAPCLRRGISSRPNSMVSLTGSKPRIKNDVTPIR